MTLHAPMCIHVPEARSVPDVPELTARIARAAFSKGNPYLRLRDKLGPVFCDAGFAELYPICARVLSRPDVVDRLSKPW